MDTNLVVADKSRTEKTICLAVSPSLKAYGIPGRARLFEVVQRVAEVNAQRQQSRSRPDASPARPATTPAAGRGRRPLALDYHRCAAPDGPLYGLSARKSIRFISSISPRRTSMSIPSTRCSLTLPTIWHAYS